MRTGTFLVICSLGALATTVVIRIAGWDGDLAFTFSIGAMAVLMLFCFPFLDSGRELGSGTRKR